mmetsp:Transcript_44669/g.54069  ORF Transcript_44669/g.54069 Transcript_44669/m.54069 type:complete len:464 (-) Transcript_44669:62-1453(-)
MYTETTRQRLCITSRTHVTFTLLLALLSTLQNQSHSFTFSKTTTITRKIQNSRRNDNPTTSTATTLHESSSSLTPQNADGFAALTSTLTLLDREYQNRRKTPDDWIPLKTSSSSSTDDGGTTTTPLPIDNNVVYLYNPRHPSPPSSLIYFVGGAGLGQFPHITYSSVLKKVAKRTDAAVLASPYAVELDHFKLAKTTGEKLRRGADVCEETYGWDLENVPQFGLAHSLGSKLMLIYAIATGWLGTDGSSDGAPLRGLGFMSFNNFGFGDSVNMARTFVKEIQGETTAADRVQGMNQDFFDAVVSFASEAVKTVGVEFTPSPAKTQELIGKKVTAEWRRGIRLFCFDNDDLDNSRDFVAACEEEGGGTGPDVSSLGGTHLTPVFLKFGVEDLPDEGARDIFGAFSDFRSVSFGNEDNVNALATEIEGWMVGKGPSREPDWVTSGSGRSGRRTLAAGVVDADVEE